MRRVQPWQQEKARTAKALRELPKCATEGCEGRATGALFGDDGGLCGRCQFKRIREQRERRERT